MNSVLSIRPSKIGTPICMHFVMTSRRCMPASRASSVGVRWIAMRSPPAVACCVRHVLPVGGDGANLFPAISVNPRGVVSDLGAADRLPRLMAQRRDDAFIDELMDTSLYSMGAYFSDEHPELVDEVIAQSVAIEETGLRRYCDQQEIPLEECFNTLLTGLAVRYYKAVAG